MEIMIAGRIFQVEIFHNKGLRHGGGFQHPNPTVQPIVTASMFTLTNTSGHPLTPGTIVTIRLDDRYPVFTGVSWVHPVDLNRFSKETGRKIAFRRALERLNRGLFDGQLTKNQRTSAWNLFWLHCKKVERINQPCQG